MPYKVCYCPIFRSELVKRHLALISLGAYKAAVDSRLDTTGWESSPTHGCPLLLPAPINPNERSLFTECCQRGPDVTFPKLINERGD